MRKHFLNWMVGQTPTPWAEPERFIPATVPGAVQLDWAAAEGWPLPEYGRPLNVRYAARGVPILADYEWMEDAYWLYRTQIEIDPPSPAERLYFVASVDYRCEIRLDGKEVHAQEGMFTPVSLDLTDRAARGSILEVLVFPAPKLYHEPIDEKQAMQSCKPAVSYGWDFHPRLIPLGIWEGGHLELRPACHVSSAEVFYQLDESLSQADVRLEVTLSQTGSGLLKWMLMSPLGETVFEREAPLAGAHCTLCASVESPELWWPNGQGKQSHYRSTVELLDEAGRRLDTCQSSVGFRRIRLVPHALSWEDPDNARFPNSRNKPPITIEVNGRVVFGKGSNWVYPDIFPGRATAETGKPATLEQLVDWGQWLQCEGLKFVFEEARRQKPVCSMALNWCFNEPWPAAANNSLVSWPAEPKPALSAAKQALRPVLASARVPKFSWTTGEVLTAELFLLNDSPETIGPGTIEAWLLNSEPGEDEKGQRLLTWNHPGTAANTNLAGPTASVTLPHLAAGRLSLQLRVPGHPEWESQYDLLARGSGF